MYDSLMRRGVTEFEHRKLVEPLEVSLKTLSLIPTSGEILIEVKGKNSAVKIVKAHSALTDSHFMEAVQRMVNSMKRLVYLIY